MDLCTGPGSVHFRNVYPSKSKLKTVSVGNMQGSSLALHLQHITGVLQVAQEKSRIRILSDSKPSYGLLLDICIIRSWCIK